MLQLSLHTAIKAIILRQTIYLLLNILLSYLLSCTGFKPESSNQENIDQLSPSPQPRVIWTTVCSSVCRDAEKGSFTGNSVLIQKHLTTGLNFVSSSVPHILLSVFSLKPINSRKKFRSYILVYFPQLFAGFSAEVKQPLGLTDVLRSRTGQMDLQIFL